LILFTDTVSIPWGTKLELRDKKEYLEIKKYILGGYSAREEQSDLGQNKPLFIFLCW
jgi:hypothetical protein